MQRRLPPVPPPPQPGEYFPESVQPKASDDLPSARYYISRTGMPHRSGEVGDYGRHDGAHITAREMEELRRSGDLEYIIYRLKQARMASP